MKAVVWCGRKHVRVESVPDPQVLDARDAIVRVTLTAICGSDLHLYAGLLPTMQPGDILGHEFMGEVVEVGDEVRTLAVGDRVVVPFALACGQCGFCLEGLSALCDNSNPNAALAEQAFGQSPAGLFGYTHAFGGFAGGQAEYVRVPFADVGPLKVPPELDDEKLLFLSDVFPTGFQAAEQCGIRAGDVVAVWGCGPVGQFAIRSALLLGAGRVVAIDHKSRRLELAAAQGGVVPLDFDTVDVHEALLDLTAGRGPDACIDAVGMESHGHTIDALYDRAKTALRLGTDRAHALRQAVRACRKGGTISAPGAYGGYVDRFPVGTFFNKGLTLKTGQTHVHRYLRPLLDRIVQGQIDPSVVISHRLPLAAAAEAYATFRDDQDDCTKVVLRP